MQHTINDYFVRDFGKGHPKFRDSFTIPAGARVKPCNDGSGEYFLDDLSHVPSFSKHDATYYGIRIPAEYVEAAEDGDCYGTPDECPLCGANDLRDCSRYECDGWPPK